MWVWPYVEILWSTASYALHVSRREVCVQFRVPSLFYSSHLFYISFLLTVLAPKPFQSLNTNPNSVATLSGLMPSWLPVGCQLSTDITRTTNAHRLCAHAQRYDRL